MNILGLFLLPLHPLSVFAAANCEQTSIEKLVTENTPVRITRTSGQTHNAKVGEPLLVGETISTSADSLVDLRLCDGSFIRLDHNSNYKMKAPIHEGDEIGSSSELKNGAIRASITPGEKKGFIKFRLETPSGSVGIRGTEFYLSYRKDTDQTSLFTFKGKVLFGKREAFNTLSATSNDSFILVEENMASTVSNKMNAPSRPKLFDSAIFRNRPIFQQSIKNQSPAVDLAVGTAGVRPRASTPRPKR